MSDILIRGMEMPTSCFDNVMLCNDGRVFVYKNGEWVKSGTAVPVPPHGRLGDLDEAEKKIVRLFNYSADGYSQDNVDGYEDGLIDAQNAVRNIPTILPASEVAPDINAAHKTMEETPEIQHVGYDDAQLGREK